MIGEWVQDSYTETSPNSEKEVSPRKKLSHRWREASCRVQQPVSWTPNLIACLYTRLQAMSTNPKGKDNRKQYWEQKLIVVAWSKKAVKHTFHSEVQARGLQMFGASESFNRPPTLLFITYHNNNAYTCIAYICMWCCVADKAFRHTWFHYNPLSNLMHKAILVL